MERWRAVVNTAMNIRIPQNARKISWVVAELKLSALWCYVTYPFKRRVKFHLPFASIIRIFNVYGSVHRKYIPIYISNKMQRYKVYLYMETALHVSGGTSTHHQERIRLYLQHLVFVTSLLLSAVIVEESELVWVCCGRRTPPTAHSNRFQLFHDSGR
jgi:hypothetical protein